MNFCRILLLCSLATGLALPETVSPADDHLVQGVEKAQLAREEGVEDYSVTERYTLRNTRFNESAEMTVAVTYKKGQGKTYRIVSRKGPSFLQNTVFDRLLKEETSMSRGTERLESLVTPANYRMKYLREEMLEGRKCEVVGLEPRRKSPHLLRGKAWVDATSHNLIRIEGKPTASPSFWASSPYVIREYTEIGAFSFARRSLALSQSFLLGRSELVVEYSDYRIESVGSK